MEELGSGLIKKAGKVVVEGAESSEAGSRRCKTHGIIKYLMPFLLRLFYLGY